MKQARKVVHRWGLSPAVVASSTPPRQKRALQVCFMDTEDSFLPASGFEHGWPFRCEGEPPFREHSKLATVPEGLPLTSGDHEVCLDSTCGSREVQKADHRISLKQGVSFPRRASRKRWTLRCGAACRTLTLHMRRKFCEDAI